jgi:hypothetical protein
MTAKRFLSLLFVVATLFSASAAVAIPIDTDFFPSEVPLYPLTPPDSPTAYFKFVDNRAWTEKEKAIVREAIREWDVVICNRTNFIETTGDVWDVSLRWAGAELFKDWSSTPGYEKWKLTTALGMWTDNLTPPWDVTKYPVKEIYLNSQYFDPAFDKINGATWYSDDNPTNDEIFTGYDLLTVAKHEFGHFLGIRGDWGQQTTPPPGKTADEVMWGRESPGVRKHLKPSDLAELKALGYHVVPEPSTFALFFLGIGAAALLKRKPMRSAKESA